MADSDSEEAFHSAGEEGNPPPSSKSEGGLSASEVPSVSSSAKSSGKEEVKNPDKATSKKSKGKKGKKKKATLVDEKGEKFKDSKDVGSDGGIPDPVDKPKFASKDETDQQPRSKSEEEKPRPSVTESVESGNQSAADDEKAEKTSGVEESSTVNPERIDKSSTEVKEHNEPSPTREESQPTCENEQLEEPKDANGKEDSGITEEKEKTGYPQGDAEQPLETGNTINRNSQGDSPQLSVSNDKKNSDEAADRTGEDKSSSGKQTDGGSEAKAAVEERSIASALGRLTGEKPAEKKASGGGWGWGGWGSSLVSSVSAVGHSLSSVIENVESSLGLPKPEELSEQEKREQQFIVTLEGEGDEKETKKEDVEGDEEARAAGGEEGKGADGVPHSEEEKREKEDSATVEDESKSPSSSGVKGFFSVGASAITNVVGKTVTGGLDALETIGRKTMDVLQEGDHGAITSKKSGQRGNLSEMLRDAKEEAETMALREEEEKERQRAHFGILFDQYQGLAHLEALEMISNQSESKVQGSLSMLSGDDLQSMKTELIEIRDAFQLEDLESEEQPEGSEQDFVNAITEHLFGVSVASTPDKLQRVQKSAHEWLGEYKSQQEAGQKQDIKEVHIKAIETLAEFSSRVIEQFHKACELMLLPQDKEHSKSPVQRATSLSKLTSVLVAEVSNQAAKFGECLDREAVNQETVTSEDINPLITNIYLEASNSTSYIQDAFQLVLPVLQMVAIEKKTDTSPSQPT